MTDFDLDELARLEKAATPGPWWDDPGDRSFALFLGNGDETWGLGHPGWMLCVEGEKAYTKHENQPAYSNGKADAALIVAMRNALPALLARITELESKLRSQGIRRSP